MATETPFSYRSATIIPGGGIDSLQWHQAVAAELAPHEVRVRVRAVSLNFRDLLIAKGLYPLTHRDAIRPVSDGAGEVTAIGRSVTQFQVGDRVTASFMRDWISGPLRPHHGASAFGGEIPGMLAEFVNVPEHTLVKLPPHTSFTDAATLPCAGVTAWHALVAAGPVKPGDTVVVQGSGGVSVFALRIAKRAGATVIATSSSDEKLAQMKEWGADEIINYRRHPHWAGELLRLTGQQGAEFVVDVGGPDTLSQSISAARTGGTVSVIGILTGVETSLSLVPVLFRQIRVQGLFVGSRQMLEDLVQSGVTGPVDRTFALDDAIEAYRYLESGRHLGKVVIELA